MHVRPVTVVDSDGGLAGRYGEQLVHQLALLVDVAAPKHRARRAAHLSNRLPLGRGVGSGLAMPRARSTAWLARPDCSSSESTACSWDLQWRRTSS
jgi:hypothetical protein